MKTITYEQFLKFEPCWLTDGRAGKLAQIGALKEHWTAVDILKLRGVEPKDKFWAVFEAELVPDPIAHEFACRCAERALTNAKVTDKRSWNAIHTKRAWLRGEATDDELAAARAAAARADRAAEDAAREAEAAAWTAAWTAAWAAAAWAAECEWQNDELLKMLRKEGWDGE